LLFLNIFFQLHLLTSDCVIIELHCFIRLAFNRVALVSLSCCRFSIHPVGIWYFFIFFVVNVFVKLFFCCCIFFISCYWSQTILLNLVKTMTRVSGLFLKHLHCLSIFFFIVKKFWDGLHHSTDNLFSISLFLSSHCHCEWNVQ